MNRNLDQLNSVELFQGFVHCAAVILDRLVENGSLERDEIDAALQAVEDRMFAEMMDYPESLDGSAFSYALPLPARILRAVNSSARDGKVLSNDDIRSFLTGDI